MKKIWYILALQISLSYITVGQKHRPELQIIPMDLIEGANTIIRSDFHELKVTNEAKYISKVKLTATLLNDKSRYRQVSIGYSPYIDIDDFVGKIYDHSGKLVKKLSKKDIIDQSSISESSIYSDYRTQTLLFDYHSYPYHIEYSYNLKRDGIVDLPDFFIQKYRTGIEHSINRLIVPDDYAFNFQAQNINLEPIVTQSDGWQIYQWETRNLNPIIPEKYAPSANEILPHIMISPAKINYFNKIGASTNWNEYGQFFYDLNRNRQLISSSLKEKINTLTKDIESDIEKIKILYKFMQDNTRYVSVQLGIGGHQTFDATYVEVNQYGDCKALTNYMKSMLLEIGIPSYAAIITAGRDINSKLDEDFTNHFGNHMILYLPKEDQFLECTSTDDPVFYVSDFIHNRLALVLTEEGGILKNTPILTEKDNQIKRDIHVDLNDKGAAELSAFIEYRGAPHDQFRYVANNMDQKEQEKTFSQYLSLLPNNNLTSFELTADPYSPRALITLKAEVPFFASSSGNRLFINPNFITYLPEIPTTHEKRNFDFVLKLAQTEIDEIKIDIPKGLKLETSASHFLQNDTPYGSLQREMRYNGDQLIFKQTLVHKAFRGGPEHYEKYRQWLLAMQKEWQPRVVFKKNLRP